MLWLSSEKMSSFPSNLGGGIAYHITLLPFGIGLIQLFSQASDEYIAEN